MQQIVIVSVVLYRCDLDRLPPGAPQPHRTMAAFRDDPEEQEEEDETTLPQTQPSGESDSTFSGTERPIDDDDDEIDVPDTGIPRCWWMVFACPMILLSCALFVAYLGSDYAFAENEALQVMVEENEDGVLSSAPKIRKKPVPHPQDTTISAETTSLHSNTTTRLQYSVSVLAAKQIDHFRSSSNTTLAVHLALPHHGSLAVCRALGKIHYTKKHFGTPHRQCVGLGAHQLLKNSQSNYRKSKEQELRERYPSNFPWSYEDTHANLNYVRQFFHFIAWPLSPTATTTTTLRDTDFEDEHLVSILVVRDPMQVLLAPPVPDTNPLWDLYPAVFHTQSPTRPFSASEWLRNKTFTPTTISTQWWAFAKSSPLADNFILQTLLGKDDCCQGAHTGRGLLSKAKLLVERVTIVLDHACLDEGLRAAAAVLDIPWNRALQTPPTIEPLVDVTKRVFHADVYHYLRSRNRRAIEFYEWAQTRALVKCQK